MKLAIDRKTCNGQIVTDAAAADLNDTHRVVNARLNHIDRQGNHHYVDVWGGTWRRDTDGTSDCTVGAMDRWS